MAQAPSANGPNGETRYGNRVQRRFAWDRRFARERSTLRQET